MLLNIAVSSAVKSAVNNSSPAHRLPLSRSVHDLATRRENLTEGEAEAYRDDGFGGLQRYRMRQRPKQLEN